MSLDRRTFMAGAGSLAATSLLRAADSEWPTWRGPNRDALSEEKGLLKSWPAGGPKLLWRVEGLGGAYSSVAISHGLIFSMGHINGEECLLALDLKDGQLRWKTPLETDGEPNCTPTVDGDKVYALGREGRLICADRDSGKVVWRVDYKKDFGGSMMSGWGYSESPLVDGNHLIVTPGAKDAMLAALDKRTGKPVWTTKVPPNIAGGAAYSSVVISNAGGVKQYVQLVGKGVIGANARTGEGLWAYERIANGTANIPTPIVKGDFVFCSTGYGTGAALLKIEKRGGRFFPNEQYFLPADTMQNHHGGMILLGDHIYCGHGHNNGFPLCLEMKTGKVAWRPGRGVGSGSAAIAYADGHFYFRYESGDVALVEPQGAIQTGRAPRAELAPPGHRRRQALPARPACAALLRHRRELVPARRPIPRRKPRTPRRPTARTGRPTLPKRPVRRPVLPRSAGNRPER
jgi:outer membrane protein assembly factor BamB